MVDPADIHAGVTAAREVVADAARRAGRAPADVEIVAAVKYVDADDLPALHAAGIRRAGENRTDQLEAKQAAHGDLFTWDFIGHLQSRKVRDLVGRVALVHALESESAAAQLAARSPAPQDVLVEVNTAADPSKYGVAPDDLDAFLELLAGLDRVAVRGLMTMPAFAETPEDSRPAFAALRETAAARGLPVGRDAHLRRALHGHQPGLRGGGRGGRDAGAAGQRASRASRPMG